MYYEDLIWMSYRYCIGRKTIVAHSHAGDIAQNSYYHFSDDRKEFMATDIRKCINDTINWRKNIDCHDYRIVIPDDGMSRIIYSLIKEHGIKLSKKFNFDDYKYVIDNSSIEIKKYEENKGEIKNVSSSFIVDFHDCLPWIKLANLFDKKCHRNITTEFNGEIKTAECFPYPYICISGDDIIIDKKWCNIERYLENTVVDSYIDDRYIIKIDDVEI